MALPCSIVHGHPEEICQQKLTGARRASREDGSSLLDCTRAPRGNMSAEADGQVKEIGDEREVRTDQGRGDPADQ